MRRTRFWVASAVSIVVLAGTALLIPPVRSRALAYLREVRLCTPWNRA